MADPKPKLPPKVRPVLPRRPTSVVPPGGAKAPPPRPAIPTRPKSVMYGSGSPIANANGPPPVQPLPPQSTAPPTATLPTTTSSTSSSSLSLKGKITTLTWPQDGEFGAPSNESNIIMEADETGGNKIKAATLHKLIERVTNASTPDPNLLQSFLLTYRSFTTPMELLNLLKQRYLQQLPEGDEASLDYFINKHQRPMRLRVYNILKTWVASHFHDFEADATLLEHFIEFVQGDLKQTGMELAAESLFKLIQRAREGTEANLQFIFTSPPPRCILPATRNPRLIKLMDLHPLEVARQLTLVESELYRNIKPQECLNQAWNKHPERAPNIISMIERFNVVSNWVVSEVVQADTQAQRVKLMQHFIDVADKCRGLNNFNASMAILAGFGDAAIFRLKDHWKAVNPKFTEVFEKLKVELSSEKNYQSFRNLLKTAEQPCIPYLGMYLTDLTFIEDGNNDTFKGLINFSKRTLVSNVIAEIQQYQQTPYHLETVPFLKKYLLSIKPLAKEKCYQLSVGILPRGKKVEEKSWYTPAAYLTAANASNNTAKSSAAVQTEAPKKKEQQAQSTYEAPQDAEFGEMEYIIGYRFAEPDSSTNIRFEADKGSKSQQVVAATIEKLVERLTHPDTAFIEAFMLTYRTFSSPKQLMELLAMRYRLPRPKNQAVLEKFKQSRELPVQLRVFNVLKIWVDKYCQDFIDNKDVCRSFLEFLKSKGNTNTAMKGASTQLQTKLKQQFDNPVKPIKGNPPPIFPLNRGADEANPQITDYHHEEIARQLCLADRYMFLQLCTYELLDRGWEPPNVSKKAPTYFKYVKRIADTAKWVLSVIKTTTQRTQTAEFFIEVMKSLYNLRNYVSLQGIIEALRSDEANEIVNWDDVSELSIAKFEEYASLAEEFKSANKIRQTLASSKTDNACLPLLDGFIEDIVSIEDSYNENVDNLINFAKKRKLAAVLKEIEVMKGNPHIFVPIDRIQAHIKAAASTAAFDVDDMKYIVKEKINTDTKLRKQIVDIVKDKLRESIDASVGIEKFNGKVGVAKNTLQQHLGNISSAIVCVSIPELQSSMRQFISQKFPGAKAEKWQFNDSTGHAYGWQMKLSVNIIHKDNQAYLCTVKPHLSKAEIATLLRIKRLYEHVNSRQINQIFVATGYSSQMAQNIASHLGVAIIMCKPKNNGTGA